MLLPSYYYPHAYEPRTAPLLGVCAGDQHVLQRLHAPRRVEALLLLGCGVGLGVELGLGSKRCTLTRPVLMTITLTLTLTPALALNPT